MRCLSPISSLALALALPLAACKPTTESAPAAPATATAPAASDETAMPAEPAATDAAASTSTPPAATPDSTATDGIGTRFKANGFSPAWRAEVDGDTVKLDMPEHERMDPGFTTIQAKRSTHAQGVEFNGKDGAHAFTLTLDGKERCNRSSDENGKLDREFTATLRYGKTVYHGCADRM